MSRLGVGKRLWGGAAGTADINWPKGCPIPYEVVLSIYSWGKVKEGGASGVMAFVFPSNHCAWWNPAFLEIALNIFLPKESSNFLFCFACVCSFALLIKLILCQPTSFLTLTPFWFSPSSHHARQWVSSCVGLSCLPGLTTTIDYMNHNWLTKVIFRF